MLTLAIIVATMGTTTAAAAQEPAAGQSAPSRDDVADQCYSAAERAQPLLRQKRFREARVLLQSCARDVCPHAARSDCREWLVEANDAQPSVLIAAHEVRGQGDTRVVRDIPGVRVVVDDTLVVDHADETPVAVDPGRHRLRVERPNAPPVVQDIDVREGEKSRIVDVYWRVPVTVAPLRPVPPSVYVSATVGVIAIGIGTYFEISGLTQRHQLDISCMPTETCTKAQVNSARDQLQTGDVIIGGGLVFLAGAAIFYLTRPSVPAPQANDQTVWVVGAIPGGFFAGARRLF